MEETGDLPLVTSVASTQNLICSTFVVCPEIGIKATQVICSHYPDFIEIIMSKGSDFIKTKTPTVFLFICLIKVDGVQEQHHACGVSVLFKVSPSSCNHTSFIRFLTFVSLLSETSQSKTTSTTSASRSPQRVSDRWLFHVTAGTVTRLNVQNITRF